VTRLSPADVEALAEGYRGGATVYELATHFRIHRTTVAQHLHRQGVVMRRQGLTNDQVDHAVVLYAQGSSLARIGARFGVDPATAWSALRTRGVPMRYRSDPAR
jgi:hypothetical protein